MALKFLRNDINILECEFVNKSGYLSFEDNSMIVNKSGNREQDISIDEDDFEEEDGSNVILTKACTDYEYEQFSTREVGNVPRKAVDGSDFPPEKAMDGNTPDKALDGNAPEKAVNGNTSEKALDGNDFPPEKAMEGNAPEKALDGNDFPPEKAMDGNTPEKAVDGNTPDKALNGNDFPPEEAMDVNTPENAVDGNAPGKAMNGTTLH